MEKAIAVAEVYNRVVNQGGRTSKDQYLSDLRRETDQTTLLQRQRQRGFYNPQQDYAFRQREIAQRWQQNYAQWEGYASKDQYLSSMQRERQGMDALNQGWATRAALLRENAEAVTKHANALSGQQKSLGQLAAGRSAVSSSAQDLTAVQRARQDLQALKSDITSQRRSGATQVPSDIIERFKQVQAEIRQAALAGSAGGIQLVDVVKLKKDLEDVQRSAAASFDGIKLKAGDSSKGASSAWRQGLTEIKQGFGDLLANARTTSKDAGDSFTRMAYEIKGAFGGGGGGGIKQIFQGLGDAVSGIASDIPGKITLIAGAILALIQLLPALSAGLGALGSVAATLPDFLGAAGGAFITFQAAVMPVIEALQKFAALVSAQEAVQAGGIQVTMQQAQAYHSLADAQFALSQAVVTGGNQQINAAHNISEAQFSLKQAYFQASIQQVQSTLSVATAMHGLQDAQFAVTQAQFQLNMAWLQAQRSLQDLEIQVGLASLNLRGAQLSLAEAQQNYAQVMASSTSTALDRAQAAYQIQQAEAALAQVQLQNTRNEQDLQNVRKYGIKQYYGVTAAQHSLVDAQFQEIMAQKQLMLTQREAANAQITAAHQISDAVFALQQAYFNQGQTAITSAHSVSDAQFQLSQAQLQLKLDAQAGGAAAVSAYNALQVALAQLSPAAKSAVQALEPIFVWWNNDTQAQQAFFGEVHGNLAKLGKDDVNLIRPLNTMINAISAALGDVAGKFVDWFLKLANSPLWNLFTQTSVTIVTNLGAAFLSLAKAFTDIAAAAAPLTDWLVKHFATWAKDFATWAQQSLKKGSMLHMLLNEAPSALQAVYQLLKSIVFFFAILAGGQPTFNKQGILTGVIPSDSQNNAFQTFLKLAGSLANTILPNLARLLNDLARPATANALINLMDALSILLVQIVQSPGFMAAFSTFLTIFTGFINALSYLVENNSIIGNVLGGIAGALVAISVLKFVGVLSLVTHLGKIAGWLREIKNAPGILGKLGTALGMGGDASTAGMQGAADTMTSAAAAMQTAADTMAAAAGKEQIAADTQAAGDAGGAAGAASGGARKGLLAGLLGTGEVLGGAGAAWLASKIPSFTGHGNILSADIKGLEQANSKLAASAVKDWKMFASSASADWKKVSSSAATDWHDLAESPVGQWFGTTLPNLFGAAGTGWSGLWSEAWNSIKSHTFDPIGNFFGGTLPGLFTDAFNFFTRDIIHPIAEWAINQLPSGIQNGFRSAVNWVIRNVIDKVIGWINDIVGKIPGVPKLAMIQQLAVGGQVAGFRRMVGAGSVSGSGDQDSEPIMATPGEWMIRKPARMALDRKLGPGFLPWLNQFDQMGYATGGEIVDYTKQFVGKVPYIWGGDTPSGWDCSGMVYDIYHHFGYNPPRTSEQQYQWAKKTQSPESGGMAFFAGSDGTQASPGHVGIIAGPDLMIDAYGTGFGTRYDTIFGSSGAVSGYGVPPTGNSGFFAGFGKSALHAFDSIFGGLGGLVHDATAGLKNIGLKSFDWLWGHTVSPLEQSLGITGQPTGAIIPNLTAKALASVQSAVNGMLSSAQNVSTGPASASAAQAQNYARGQLSRYGWGSSEMQPLVLLWDRESGWDRFATNPTSGAFGIPQALPYSKMPKAAWPMWAGGQAAAGTQIDWGLGYIKSRPGYGSPSAAWQHELAQGWYAGGGPIGASLFPVGHPDPNFGRASVPWWVDVQFPASKPSPGMASGGPVQFGWGGAYDLLASAFKDESSHAPWFLRDATTRRRQQANMAHAFASIAAHHGRPTSIPRSAWATLLHDTGLLMNLSGRHDKHLLPYVRALSRAENRAFKQWGSLVTPHPTGTPPPFTSYPAALPDISSLLNFGPAVPYYSGGSSMPDLASFSAAPRTVGVAAAAGMSAGGPAGSAYQVDSITINNPVPETAGESLTRATQKLAFLAGRGAV